MKFTIYTNPQSAGASNDVAQIDVSIEQAIRVTEAGFDGVALTEHHVSGYNTFGDNMVMAAHLAPQVRRGTRFLMTTIVPQMHHPIRLAQLCNLLDILCRGEIIIGMGAGGSPLEFFAIGRDPANRHKEMMEVLDVVEAALAHKPGDPHLHWKTSYGAGLISTRIMPTSYSKSPKFARATQSDEGVIWTAQKGWFLMTARATLDVIAHRFRLYRAEMEKAGHDSALIAERMEWSSMARQVIVAETDKEAQAQARTIMARLAEGVKRSANAPSPLGPNAPTYTRDYLGVSAEDPDKFIEAAMIVGSPETVSRKLQDCVDAGIPHIKLCFNYGHMTREETNRQLTLFLDEVYPRFRQLSPRNRKADAPATVAAQ